MPAASLQRETYEFMPVTVKDRTGAVFTGAWHYQITAEDSRPTGTWVASVSHASRKGADIQALPHGTYLLWIRIDDDPPYLPVPQPVLFFVA